MTVTAHHWNIRTAGAVGDGQTIDTAAIQSSIDGCSASGGGIVVVPPGCYLTGTIVLKTGVTLCIEAGATLLGSTNPADYPPSLADRTLIHAHDAQRISLIGYGTINGQGQAFYNEKLLAKRPRMIEFQRCQHVQIRDLTLLESGSWTVKITECDNVNIDGITLLNDLNRKNTDGIDPVSSRNVRIANCHIETSDDAIVLKTLRDGRPCEYVTITNCTLRTIRGAIKIGTETSSDIRHVTFSNNSIWGTTMGIIFCVRDGGTIEDISITGTTMDLRRHPVAYNGHTFPILMSLADFRHQNNKITPTAGGRIRNILIGDLLAQTAGPCIIGGLPNNPIENLTLRDISLRFRETFVDNPPPQIFLHHNPFIRSHPAALVAHNVRGLNVRNFSAQWDDQRDWSAVSCIDSSDLHLEAIASRGNRPENPAALVRLTQCQDALVQGCICPPQTGPFLEASGERCCRISVMGNDLTRAGAAVRRLDNAPADTIHLASNRDPGPRR